MLTPAPENILSDELKQYHPFGSLPNEAAISVRKDSATKTASEVARCLKERFGATKVALFGSVTRTDFNRWSDIDLAAWGIPATDYFKAVAFASGYSSVFKIDLVDSEDCSPSLREHIEKNGVAL